jgi:hypothetical protein
MKAENTSSLLEGDLYGFLAEYTTGKGTIISIGVNLSPGEWNSRLDKQSPPAQTNEK